MAERRAPSTAQAEPGLESAPDARILRQCTDSNGEGRSPPRGLSLGLSMLPQLSHALSAGPAVSTASSGRKLLGNTATEIEDKDLRALLNFDGCEALLRGCRLRTVLRRGSGILSSSTGDASTFALSEQTSRLQAFVSHNWSVSRWRKYTCLALHYNSRLGIAAAVVVTAASPLVHYYGWLPTYSFNGIERGWAARVATVPAAMFALYFGRDVLPALRGPLVFLDKVCIHQEDKELQRQAILKLGAFLKASDTMLICYTDVYLKKLWTVYEVASYLSLFGAGRMHFMHCSVSFGMTIAIISWYVVDLAVMVLQIVYGHSWSEFAVMPFALVCISFCFRAMLRGRESMHKNMVNFSVHACICLREEDRVVVYQNIVALMQASHERELSPSAALELFNDIVREELPPTMDAVFGRFGMPLRATLLPPALILLPRIADGLPWLWHGGTWRLWYTKICLYYVCCVFIFALIWVMVTQCINRVKLHGGTAATAAVTVTAPIVGMISPVGGRFLLNFFEDRAESSDAWLAGFTAFAVLGSALTIQVYRHGRDIFRCCATPPAPAQEPREPKALATAPAGAAQAAALEDVAAATPALPQVALGKAALDILFSDQVVSALV